MKKTNTTTTTTATVTRLARKAMSSDFQTYAPATTAPAPVVYEEKAPLSICDGLLDYIYRNNVYKAITTAYLKGLESKGNMTAGALLRGENAPFNREDLESVCLTALCGYVAENGVTIEKDGNLPADMVLYAFRTMSSGEEVDTIAGKRVVSGMYAQGTRVYKWLYVDSTPDDDGHALNDIAGTIDSISDIETRLALETLYSTLTPDEKWLIRKRLVDTPETEIARLYSARKGVSIATAWRHLSKLSATLARKGTAQGFTR